MQSNDKPGFTQILGFKRESWSAGEGVVSLELEPSHLNGFGIVHGGVLLALLDVATGMSGLYCAKKGNRRTGMTVSLTTNFVGQASSGRLIATGRMTSSGRRLYFATAEVRTEAGALIATGTAVHRFSSGSENPEGVPAGQLRPAAGTPS